MSSEKCRSCGTSPAVQKFDAEVAIHFPRLDGLTKPIVRVFPRILVCLDCGFTGLVVPDEQKKTLRNPEEQDLQKEVVPLA